MDSSAVNLRLKQEKRAQALLATVTRDPAWLVKAAAMIRQRGLPMGSVANAGHGGGSREYHTGGARPSAAGGFRHLGERYGNRPEKGSEAWIKGMQRRGGVLPDDISGFLPSKLMDPMAAQRGLTDNAANDGRRTQIPAILTPSTDGSSPIKTFPTHRDMAGNFYTVDQDAEGAKTVSRMYKDPATGEVTQQPVNPAIMKSVRMSDIQGAIRAGATDVATNGQFFGADQKPVAMADIYAANNPAKAEENRAFKARETAKKNNPEYQAMIRKNYEANGVKPPGVQNQTPEQKMYDNYARAGLPVPDKFKPAAAPVAAAPAVATSLGAAAGTAGALAPTAAASAPAAIGAGTPSTPAKV